MNSNKLEPEISQPVTRIDVDFEHVRDVDVPESETSSIVQVEMPPWAETYEISSTDVEGNEKRLVVKNYSYSNL